MKVFSLGVIVEVGVPKYSNIRAEDDSLNEVVREFLKSLKQLGPMKVVYADYHYGSATEIKNFNYNIYNQAEQHPKYRVFRFFSNKLYVTSSNELNLDALDELFWFRHNNLLFCITPSSLGKHEPTGKEPEFLGISRQNSGEVVEERVVQYRLF
jgi:hypothetical protein